MLIQSAVSPSMTEFAFEELIRRKDDIDESTGMQ